MRRNIDRKTLPLCASIDSLCNDKITRCEVKTVTSLHVSNIVEETFISKADGTSVLKIFPPSLYQN